MAATSPRPASHGAPADDGRAVRWAARAVRGEPDWTRWHWVDDGSFTACGRWVPVPFVAEAETSGDQAAVNCKRCRRWLDGRRKGR